MPAQTCLPACLATLGMGVEWRRPWSGFGLCTLPAWGLRKVHTWQVGFFPSLSREGGVLTLGLGATVTR